MQARFIVHVSVVHWPLAIWIIWSFGIWFNFPFTTTNRTFPQSNNYFFEEKIANLELYRLYNPPANIGQRVEFNARKFKAPASLNSLIKLELNYYCLSLFRGYDRALNRNGTAFGDDDDDGLATNRCRIQCKWITAQVHQKINKHNTNNIIDFMKDENPRINWNPEIYR